MDRMKKLTEAIGSLIEEEFSGYIKINFSQGSLGRVEKSEEIADAAISHPVERISNFKKKENDVSNATV